MPAIWTAFAQGTHAARPAAATSNQGYAYWESDTYTLFQSTGSAWQQVAWTMTPPAVRCYNSGSQSIGSSSGTALTFDSNRFDQGTSTAQHSTSVNTSRLTCQVAGIYHITGNIDFAGASGGTNRVVWIRLNGSTIIGIASTAPQGAATDVRLCVTTLYSLSVADYVELIVFQDSGGNLNVTAQPNYSPEFMMARDA